MAETNYKVKRKVKDEDKLAPQERVVFDAIDSQKDPTRSATIEKVQKLIDAGKVTSKQDGARLVNFYQGRLKEKGLIECTRVSTAKEKPPKGKKAA